MRVVTDYGPDNAEEQALKLELMGLEMEYRERIRPLIDRLVQLHAMKTPKIVLFPNGEPIDEWPRLLPERSGY